MMANLGFSGRACMVKHAYKKGGKDPLTVLATLSFTGAAVLLLPMGAWPFTAMSSTTSAEGVGDWSHRPSVLDENLGLWLAASAS
eukprot:CAMPEP_0115327800 /NCGR_PEP_ID=MMETSP0270-20121206/84329_1 /TAXON_ID=71861 /ORGANISM="Scrippsiella trochoidea, Strain CCMP3099" /LENGTH=84 /DNA_ID=CAMNT_0002748257 /DNA_START=524 /DNA_END=775 /DNA_ORIENTATION=-